VLIFVAAWLIPWRDSSLEKGAKALRAAYASTRPTISLNSALSIARWPKTRGTEDEIADPRSLARAQGLIGEAAVEHPSPEADHLLGCLKLAEGDFDRAIKLLGSAVAAKPADARFQNDLGAAYLERGRLHQNGQIGVFDKD